MAENQDFEKAIQEGLNLPPERKIYFNGFVVSTTITDVVIVLQNNNQPVILLNTSHMIGKTLVAKLQQTLRSFEKGSGTHIVTLDKFEKKIQRKSNADDSGNTQQN
jgi:hypothetical protein